MSGRVRTLARSREGQMTVELAVCVPVILVVTLILLNLLGYVEACAAFDQASKDAVISQGIATDGSSSQTAAVAAVQEALEEALGREDRCEVEVRAESLSDDPDASFAISPLLTRYVCTLVYHPWPRLLRMPGITYEAPLTLQHECSLVVDRYRSGVIA